MCLLENSCVKTRLRLKPHNPVLFFLSFFHRLNPVKNITFRSLLMLNSPHPDPRSTPLEPLRWRARPLPHLPVAAAANPSPCAVEDRGQIRWIGVCVEGRIATHLSCPSAPITLFSLRLSSVIFTLDLSRKYGSQGGRKNNLASLFRSQGGIRKVEKWCITSLGQRTLSFESFFIFLLDTHSSGFHKSTGGLRTAFSGAVGGLARHNQRRITERRRELGSDGRRRHGGQNIKRSLRDRPGRKSEND